MLGLNRTKIWKTLTFIIPYTLLNSMHTYLCGTIKSLINQTSNILCVCTRMRSHSVVSLCNPMNCSPQGSSIHGIFQARILPFPIPGDLPDPGMEPASLVAPASTGGFFTTSITNIGVQVHLYI